MQTRTTTTNIRQQHTDTHCISRKRAYNNNKEVEQGKKEGERKKKIAR